MREAAVRLHRICYSRRGWAEAFAYHRYPERPRGLERGSVLSLRRAAQYRLDDGDILFARTGATTGKSLLVRQPPESVFASYLIRIRPGTRVLPEYVWWYFQSPYYWASVMGEIDVGNRPNMNGAKLAALRIPFPKSKAEQSRIVGHLDALAAKQAELRRLQTETEAELAAFTPALLAKAFRGEL